MWVSRAGRRVLFGVGQGCAGAEGVATGATHSWMGKEDNGRSQWVHSRAALFSGDGRGPSVALLRFNY